MSPATEVDPAVVLIVEDNKMLGGILAVTLEAIGYEVHVATSGMAGFELACEKRPDVIVSDYSMDGMDGTELCKKVRAEPTLKKTRFIMISARIDPGSSEKRALYGLQGSQYTHTESQAKKVRTRGADPRPLGVVGW